MNSNVFKKNIKTIRNLIIHEFNLSQVDITKDLIKSHRDIYVKIFTSQPSKESRYNLRTSSMAMDVIYRIDNNFSINEIFYILRILVLRYDNIDFKNNIYKLCEVEDNE